MVWSICEPLLDRPFLAAVVHGYEGDVGLENGDMGRVLRIGDADLVGNRSVSFADFLTVDSEDGAIADTMAELDLVHRDRDELAVRELRRGGDPCSLIDPCEQPAAEERTVLVQVTGKDEMVRFQNFKL